jgi:hypothetical protein
LLRRKTVREETRRLLMALGASVALVGALLIAVAVAADQRPYSPPPGCEAMACPSPDPAFGLFGVEDRFLPGVAVVVSGLAIVFAATLAIELPLTRADEEVLLEKLERVARRFD